MRAPRIPLHPALLGVARSVPAALLTACALSVSAVLLTACTSSGNNQVTSPTVLGMTSTVTPAYDDGEQQIYQVKVPVTLPLRRPTSAEASALKAQDPYPRAPFLLNSDLQIEIRYTVTNLDPTPHNVDLLLDPWNEFVRYVPGLQIDEDDVLPDQSGYDRSILLAPMSRSEGIITSDDMTELAIDLATVEDIQKHPPTDPDADVNGLMNHVFDPQNRSNDGDPLISQYIPKVIAGLTGFDLGLRTVEKANVAVEITIEIVDLNGDRVLPFGSTDSKLGRPGTTITPPGAHPL